jgi:nicotinate phosphoribosyltransferase
MEYAVMQKFPTLKVRYTFINRNKTPFPKNFDKDVTFELQECEKLRLTGDEKRFMTRKFGSFLPPTYIDFLAGYRYDSDEVNVTMKGDQLIIEIEGYWYRTILWETTIMSIVSELYFIKTGQEIDIEQFENRDLDKLQTMIDHNAYFSDFGTRRRYSFANQERIVKLYKKYGNHCFVGTSNVYLSYKYDVGCTGTHAHEWFMVHAALFGYKMANKLSLEDWAEVYGGRLGTALTDTFTTDSFFKSFDMKLSKLFDGVRHDSADPFIFTDKSIKHYESLGIDPMSKTIIFSDGLNTELAVKIKEYCVGKIKSAFGIGTFLTNDVGVKPLNIVIKISEVLIDGVWVPTVKLSDNSGKHTGKEDEIDLCKRELRLKN